MAPLNKFDVLVNVDDNDYIDTRDDDDNHYVDADGDDKTDLKVNIDRIQFQTTVRSSQTKIGLAFFTT